MMWGFGGKRERERFSCSPQAGLHAALCTYFTPFLQLGGDNY